MPQWPLPTTRRTSHDESTGSPLSRRALFAAGAVGFPTAVAVGAALPAAADPSVTGGDTSIVDVPLVDAPLVDVDGIEARDLPGHLATMVGATWPADVEEPRVHARGRQEDGTWSAWFELETALDPETGDRAPGTELAWLGNVTDLQLRGEIDGTDVTESMTAHVVTTSPAQADAGIGDLSGPTATQPQSRQLQAQATATATNPATPVLGPGAPTFVSRASWKADESLTRSTSGSGQLKAVIIHHTAGTNSYSSSQSAQIVRGILMYHTRTLGWADIGYNILVDKYGRIFEGRSGGLHRNIIGAHAYGFNTDSFGISVMGDYSSTTVPAAARDAVSMIVGWKLLSTFHTSAWDKTSWTPGSGTRFTPNQPISLAPVLGHRDVNYTECPGARLYSQFDRIRADAQKRIDGGWRVHLNGFQRAGGEAALGTVVRSAHQNGMYWVTELTKGLVLSEGNGGATGYATPFASAWQATWGRPLAAAAVAGDTTTQDFEFGQAKQVGAGSVRFGVPLVPSRGVYSVEYSDQLYYFDGKHAERLTFARWKALGNPVPKPAPVRYHCYSWSGSISACHPWTADAATWTWVHLDGNAWSRAGRPTPTVAGFIGGSRFYSWETAPGDILVEDPGGVHHHLSAAEWEAAGRPRHEVIANQGYVQMSWESGGHIAFMSSLSAGTGRHVSRAQWDTAGNPVPKKVNRLPGDRVYKKAGGPDIWYEGPAVTKQLSYVEWVRMGRPRPL